MEGATARSIDLAEFIPAHRVHTLERQLEQTQTDLKSARVRNAALLKALNGMIPADKLLTKGFGDSIADLIVMACEIERSGRVPVVRFARGEANQVIGIELAVLRSEPAPADHRLIEMEVLA